MKEHNFYFPYKVQNVNKKLKLFHNRKTTPYILDAESVRR